MFSLRDQKPRYVSYSYGAYARHGSTGTHKTFTGCVRAISTIEALGAIYFELVQADYYLIGWAIHELPKGMTGDQTMIELHPVTDKATGKSANV